MFVRNAWYVAAWDHEVPRQDMLRRTLLDEPVVLYRRGDGAPVALADRCAHRHAPLSEGRLIGDEIQCPYHGLTYDPSGRCTGVPGQTIVPPDARVRSYPVVERDRFVWIWMGDADLADPDRITDFHWLGDLAWRHEGFTFHVAGNYLLVVDNLLDQSHLTFVHPTTIGTGAILDADIKTERSDDGVRVSNWVLDSPAPPAYQRSAGFAPDQRVDRWLIIDFTPPGFLRFDIGAAPVGSGARDGDRSRAIGFRNLNAVTPETARTTHYFWAQCHNFALDDPSMTRLIGSQIHRAFEEDLVIIRAQQENMDLMPGAPWVDKNADAGAIHARRLVDRLIRDERQMAEAAAGR